MKGKDIGNAVDTYVDLMDMVKDENFYGIVDDDGCRDCILRLPDYIGGDKEEEHADSLDVLFDRSDKMTIERAKFCVVAAPLGKTDGAGKDDLTVFSIAKNEQGRFTLKREEDEEVSRAVLDKYRQMTEETRKNS